ncbi:MAG: S9 family peptidase [Weeksellaceae bacterium]|jgi:dipeptidyl aminopeptidase/acylaminoacyl peptidase|nr:S9 family peptidase [Weeksellaceae bacterium]
MKLKLVLILGLAFITHSYSQNMMTPELLWKLKRISPVGITDDGKNVVYSVTEYQVEKGEKTTKSYLLPIQGGKSTEISDYSNLITDKSLSPDKSQKIEVEKIKLEAVLGKDLYPKLQESNVYVYNDLHYRHWDTWSDGTFNHLILKNTNHPDAKGIDLLKDEPFHSPQMPFGGNEDFTWNKDGSKILYVAKKLKGKDYALSTNTDIYEYDIKTQKTVNLTDGMPGYDTSPAFSKDGVLAFLSMARDGYEADKSDIILLNNGVKTNLTQHWDGTVGSFQWSKDGKYIYFNAPVGGTIQLFSVQVDLNSKKKDLPKIKQITDGQFDVAGLVGESGNEFIISRTDMNHAAELYAVNLKNGEMRQLTNINKAIYSKIKLSPIEKRIVKTTDNKDMVAWVIFPPDFDPNKKYPTLLYCQGGPQSPLSQFYSYRWNFQLMAANGYIIIAPNRRGMQGHGVEWNEAISKDWGGQVMQDYLSAIDDISKESYVDTERLGAIGASYGGYSVFYLAGIHNKRFKSFIAHDGVFNLKSMYGTTEELWFTNWDAGGAYWETDNKVAMKTYTEFDPSNFVNKWDTPILIIQGGKDYRVPIGQGLEAFQAAQLHGLKSRLLYFPDENHWVLNPQNSVIWHTEFYKWLKETL